MRPLPRWGGGPTTAYGRDPDRPPVPPAARTGPGPGRYSSGVSPEYRGPFAVRRPSVRSPIAAFPGVPGPLRRRVAVRRPGLACRPAGAGRSLAAPPAGRPPAGRCPFGAGGCGPCPVGAAGLGTAGQYPAAESRHPAKPGRKRGATAPHSGPIRRPGLGPPRPLPPPICPPPLSPRAIPPPRSTGDPGGPASGFGIFGGGGAYAGGLRTGRRVGPLNRIGSSGTRQPTGLSPCTSCPFGAAACGPCPFGAAGRLNSGLSLGQTCPCGAAKCGPGPFGAAGLRPPRADAAAAAPAGEREPGNEAAHDHQPAPIATRTPPTQTSPSRSPRTGDCSRSRGDCSRSPGHRSPATGDCSRANRPRPAPDTSRCINGTLPGKMNRTRPRIKKACPGRHAHVNEYDRSLEHGAERHIAATLRGGDLGHVCRQAKRRGRLRSGPQLRHDRRRHDRLGNKSARV